VSERASYILPRDEGAAPLDFVIAVMAFLAALALGASLVATRAAHGWQSGLSDRITVQVMPPEQGDPRAALDAETKAVLSVLGATPGIAHANLLSDAEINALVEPWIGKDGAVAGIPLPRLIDAAIVPGEDMDVAALAAKLKQAAPHASVDDHRRWIVRLRTNPSSRRIGSLYTSTSGSSGSRPTRMLKISHRDSFCEHWKRTSSMDTTRKREHSVPTSVCVWMLFWRMSERPRGG